MNRSALPRPTLLPGLTRVWRNQHTLQLGLDPARAVLIDLPDPRTARMLDLLDGTRPERVVFALAAEHGIAAADARDLLDTLHSAGLVMSAPSLLPSSLPDETRHRLSGEAAALALDRATAGRSAARHSAVRHSAARPDHAPDPPGTHDPAAATPAQILRRRTGARVVLAGRGRLGAGIAVALAQAGVGHVHPDLVGTVTAAELAGTPLRGTDVDRPRADAAAEAVHRAAPQTQTHSVRRLAPSLIVQLGYDQPVALLAASFLHRRQPHLPVIIREGAAVVGPFVPATGAPCLNCVDLHRRERDADWPDLSVQFTGAAPEPCGVATVLAVIAYVTGETLAFLDGKTPETMGASVDISAPGRFRRRTWPSHQACGCLRTRPRRAGGTYPASGASWG